MTSRTYDDLREEKISRLTGVIEDLRRGLDLRSQHYADLLDELAAARKTAEAASRRADRAEGEASHLTDALRIIAAQGGDITEPWAAETARRALWARYVRLASDDGAEAGRSA